MRCKVMGLKAASLNEIRNFIDGHFDTVMLPNRKPGDEVMVVAR
ncbi:hypothetical protein ACS5NO_31785 [Larkinella sp. GY13]